METYKSLCLCVIVLLNGAFYSLGEIVSPNAYSQGCSAVYESLFNEPDIFAKFLFFSMPSCIDDVFWRHYQCDIEKCYCVYVDTGNRLPHTQPDSYYQYKMTFADYDDFCPYKFENTADGCKQPKGHYPCDITGPRYVYNSTSQQCEFSTNPCYGFDDIKKCESQCVPAAKNPCSLKLDQGKYCSKSSKKEHLRFYYDPKIAGGSCVPFHYHGCGGNSNRYQFMWECEKSCGTQQLFHALLRVNRRTTYNVTMPEWIHMKYRLDEDELNDVSTQTLKQIKNSDEAVKYFKIDTPSYGSTIPIPDLSDEELERQNSTEAVVCRLPAKTGFCRAYFPRWYFDHVQSKCIKFVYGGCQPNGNNFRTADECTDYCRATYTPSPEELTATPKPGAGNPSKVVTTKRPKVKTPYSGNVHSVQGRNFIAQKPSNQGEILYYVPLQNDNQSNGTTDSISTTASPQNTTAAVLPETAAASAPVTTVASSTENSSNNL